MNHPGGDIPTPPTNVGGQCPPYKRFASSQLSAGSRVNRVAPVTHQDQGDGVFRWEALDHAKFMVLEFGFRCKFGGRGLGRRTSARVSRTDAPSPSEGVPLFDKEG